MNGESETVVNAQKSDTTDQRQRSSISFPYTNLKQAIELTAAIHSNVGLGECDDAQLSAWTNQSPKSSGFRTQIYAARMFGLIAANGSKHRLTILGHTIIDPQQTRAAKVQAFLNVPLYSAVFEKFKGSVLPPTAALEREMVSLGVSEKQRDRARSVFEQSAQEAGFFEHGRNRLVQPGVAAMSDQSKPDKDGGWGGGNGGGDDHGGGNDNKRYERLPSLISALIDSLPDDGQKWSLEEATDWLQTAAYNFRYAYKMEGILKVVITPIQKDKVQTNEPSA